MNFLAVTVACILVSPIVTAMSMGRWVTIPKANVLPGYTLDCDGEQGLKLCNQCFIVPRLSRTRKYDYDDAIIECALRGGALAEIHDYVQQKALGDFIRTRMPVGMKLAHLWVGMRNHFRSNKVEYRTGKMKELSAFYKCEECGVACKPFWTAMVSNSTGEPARLWDQHESRKMHGVLCEKWNRKE